MLNIKIYCCSSGWFALCLLPFLRTVLLRLFLKSCKQSCTCRTIKGELTKYLFFPNVKLSFTIIRCTALFNGKVCYLKTWTCRNWLSVPLWLLIVNRAKPETYKSHLLFTNVLSALLCHQCLSTRGNKETRAFWHGRGERTGQSVLYNDETAKTAHWIDVDLKDFYRALFELSTFFYEEGKKEVTQTEERKTE